MGGRTATASLGEAWNDDRSAFVPASVLHAIGLNDGDPVLVIKGMRRVILSSVSTATQQPRSTARRGSFAILASSDAPTSSCRLSASVMDALETRSGDTIELSAPTMVLEADPQRSFGQVFMLDGFGNPAGTQWDLGGQDTSRTGGRILLYWTYNYEKTAEHFILEDAAEAVAERGFTMDITRSWRNKKGLSSKVLASYDQLWVASDNKRHLDDGELAAVEQYARSGRGVLIWADNDPYTVDATLLGSRLVGCRFSGNWRCDKLMRPSQELRPGFFIHHPLTTGLENLYEGITLPTITLGQGSVAIAQAADGPINMAA